MTSVALEVAALRQTRRDETPDFIRDSGGREKPVTLFYSHVLAYWLIT